MIHQNERLLEYLQTHGSVTQIEALRDLGIMRLASRVSDLKRQGYAIGRTMIYVRNRWNEKNRVARYFLHE